MFKRSRRRIVASILATLVLLLFGTICVIYLASYADMTSKNQWLLKQYVETYSLSGKGEPDAPAREPASGTRVPPPRLELSTFYSVALSKGGELLKADTADVASIDEAALVQLAAEIIESGRTEGVEQNLIYRAADKGGYDLVAFLDNTVMRENTATLINYTLIFGSAALAPLFFLARWLAGRIVAPLEESYRRQKQFVSDAGHELKTPVSVVGANLELLHREIGENQWLSNIQYENERMSSLISQLLELARTENISPPMEPLDMSRLVWGETLPFEAIAYESGLRLELEIAEGVHLCGNGVQLKQLVAILLDNAIRHGAPGGTVSLALREEKNCAVLSTVNDGEEIPPDQRQNCSSGSTARTHPTATAATTAWDSRSQRPSSSPTGGRSTSTAAMERWSSPPPSRCTAGAEKNNLGQALSEDKTGAGKAIPAFPAPFASLHSFCR